MGVSGVFCPAGKGLYSRVVWDHFILYVCNPFYAILGNVSTKGVKIKVDLIPVSSPSSLNMQQLLVCLFVLKNSTQVCP